MVESPSLEIFQPRLDAVLCSLLWVTLLGQGVGLGDRPTEVPSNPCHAGILWLLWFCDFLNQSFAIEYFYSNYTTKHHEILVNFDHSSKLLLSILNGQQVWLLGTKTEMNAAWSFIAPQAPALPAALAATAVTSALQDTSGRQHLSNSACCLPFSVLLM